MISQNNFHCASSYREIRSNSAGNFLSKQKKRTGEVTRNKFEIVMN